MTSQHNDVTMTSHCSAAPPTVAGGVVGGLLLTVGVADRAGFDGSELLLRAVVTLAGVVCSARSGVGLIVRYSGSCEVTWCGDSASHVTWSAQSGCYVPPGSSTMKLTGSEIAVGTETVFQPEAGL